MAGSSRPRYRDLAASLRREIEAGRFGVGARIPTEIELCEARGVSRTTVRQAVQQLVDEGVLDRQQGRGTFVTALPRPDGALFGAPGALAHDFRVVEAVWRAAPANLAAQFGLSPEGQLFCLTRVQLEAGRPVAIKRYFAPADVLQARAPTSAEIEGALFDAILRSRGVRLARMNITAEPALLGDADAALLESAPGALALHTQRVGFNEHGRAVRLSQTVLAAEQARLFWSVGWPNGKTGRAGVDFSVWTAAALD